LVSSGFVKTTIVVVQMSGPASVNSNAFSFNFHISDADEPAVPEICNETANVDDMNHANVQSFEHRPRLPFKWIDDDYVKAIMSERCKQALVYSEIPLVSPDGPEEVGSTVNGTDLCRLQSEAVGSESVLLDQTETPRPQPPTTMRCVDLSLSSFRKKSPNEEFTEQVEIVPGIYEGGRQVWECSLDLLHYLVHNHVTLQQFYDARNHNVISREGNIPLEEIRHDSSTKTYVLELGCGHGLPGIYLLRQALQRCDMNPAEFTVVLTDYNENVLVDATISNTVLNCVNETSGDDRPGTNTSDAVAKHIVMGGGDWLDMSYQMSENLPDNEMLLSKLPLDGYFDLILAAETIYTTSTAHETTSLLKRHLRPETGIAYIASKRYYFGVGGGVDAFRECCTNVMEESHPLAGGQCRLIVNTVKVIDNGTGNIREILCVQSRRY
jgi:SAM-dependent methyltransferase